MSIGRRISFRADVLNGKILEKPKTFEIDCDRIQLLGMNTFKDYDKNECIITMKGFTILFDGMFMANRDFTKDTFIAYRNSECMPCGIKAVECGITLNNCLLTLNGCILN